MGLPTRRRPTTRTDVAAIISPANTTISKLESWSTTALRHETYPPKNARFASDCSFQNGSGVLRNVGFGHGKGLVLPPDHHVWIIETITAHHAPVEFSHSVDIVVELRGREHRCELVSTGHLHILISLRFFPRQIVEPSIERPCRDQVNGSVLRVPAFELRKPVADVGNPVVVRCDDAVTPSEVRIKLNGFLCQPRALLIIPQPRRDEDQSLRVAASFGFFRESAELTRFGDEVPAFERNAQCLPEWWGGKKHERCQDEPYGSDQDCSADGDTSFKQVHVRCDEVPPAARKKEGNQGVLHHHACPAESPRERCPLAFDKAQFAAHGPAPLARFRRRHADRVIQEKRGGVTERQFLHNPQPLLKTGCWTIQRERASSSCVRASSRPSGVRR